MEVFIDLHQFDDWALLLLRATVGTIFVVHGLAKWKMRQDSLLFRKLRNLMGFLSVAEPAGGAALILGFFTQFVASGLILVMVGAIIFKISVMQRKFSEDGGWEFDFLLLAANMTLFFLGGGGISLDRFMWGI